MRISSGWCWCQPIWRSEALWLSILLTQRKKSKLVLIQSSIYFKVVPPSDQSLSPTQTLESWQPYLKQDAIFQDPSAWSVNNKHVSNTVFQWGLLTQRTRTGRLCSQNWWYILCCVTRIDHSYSIEQKNTSNNGSIQVNRVVAVVYIVISSEIVPRA